MSEATSEGLKEVGRWLLCFAVGWFLEQILAQLTKVPEFFNLHLWVFVFNIPVRLGIQGVISLGLRFLDKWQHETGKETKSYPKVDVPSFGWLRF